MRRHFARATPGVLVAGMVGIAACSEPGVTPPVMTGQDQGLVRIVHTSVRVPAVDVFVANERVLANLRFGTTSTYVGVPAGNQPVSIVPAGSSVGPVMSLLFQVGDSVTLLTVDSSNVINPWVLSDSGAAVPAGKSKLRVVHFADSAPPVDVWRTQPDFAQLITVMFPFSHRAVSPYLQSDSGVWTVLVTTERRDGAGLPVVGDSLAATGGFAIPDGESRTVILMDQSGGGVLTTVIVP